jgi:hypothetical protein
MNRKLRMGMVGGGKDAFIGSIHRLAANMDGLIEIVAGALSIQSGQWRKKVARCYSWLKTAPTPRSKR